MQQRTLELQHLTETLEERVKERTAELASLTSQLVSVQENKRRRVSYDLHGNVWQLLLAIRSEIERLFSNPDGIDRAALQDKSKQVMAASLDTVGKIRSMPRKMLTKIFWRYTIRITEREAISFFRENQTLFPRKTCIIHIGPLYGVRSCFSVLRKGKLIWHRHRNL